MRGVPAANVLRNDMALKGSILSICYAYSGIITRFLRVHENTITTGYAIATRLGQLQAPSLEVGI